jgi:cytochrome oxidase assembly protein ShyY1
VKRRRALVAIVAGVLGFALTLSLGNWQSRRAELKRALQSQWDAAVRDAALVVNATTLRDLPARMPVRVSLTGRFQHRFSVWLDNRQSNGHSGFFVVAPFETADGIVLVSRGWVARDVQDRLRLPSIGTPLETLTIEGIALAQLPRLLQLGADVETGKWPLVWQNLDFESFERASGLHVARFVVQQTSRVDDGLVRDWPAPDLGVDKHRGYALQWYSLAALIAVLTLFFGWRSWRAALALRNS